MAKNYLKRFMGWDTGSKNNLFLWARLKLTFLYVLIIAVILAAFSVGLYFSLQKNIKDTIDEEFKGHDSRQAAIQKTDAQVKEAFVIGNVILLIVSGGLAFFLARKNLRPIENTLEEQRRFTANASHDLRTPLTIMKTDCEVILRKSKVDFEEFRVLVKSNIEEIDRMSRMVEQLLFLSRNNAMPNQQLGQIALGKLAETIVENFQSLAKNKNVALVLVEIAEGNIKGSQLDLEKLFFNLFKNAIDYTPPGGKVEVMVKKNKNQMELTVRDTGIGISVEDLPHITEAFYKADKARSEEAGGSGLGLSIIKEIVESHRGKLVINSKLNVGTEIKASFPILSV